MQVHNSNRDREHPTPDKATILKTRACTNCARLKMKCQWPASGAARPETSCVRCARMKLGCQVPEPTQRRKRGKSTRVAQLEKKIDGIVSLLAATQQIQATTQNPLTPESPENNQLQQQILEENGEACAESGVPQDVAPDFSKFELLPGFQVTFIQATEYLNIYRREYVPKYPFVPLPADIPPHILYGESRLLFWSVMAAVAPLPGSVQLAFKKWFRRYLAEHMVVQQEKKLEFLQAILVHLGWNDFHFYIEMQATNLIQLAMALVIDLKLDRPPGFIGVTPRSLVSDAWTTLNQKEAGCRNNLKTTHTHAEKRALLGYHHISCLINALFRRGTQFQWTTYMGKCCDSLIESHEYETDLLLVALVKMQHVTDRVFSIMPCHSYDYQDPTLAVFRAPFDMAIGGVRKEMETFANSQPEIVKQSRYFWAFYHVFILRLYEPVIVMKAPSLADSETLPSEPFRRAEALWQCLQSVNSYFEQHLNATPEEVTVHPFTVTGTMAFVIVTSSRLVLLESSTDWDPALARKKLDFADLMQRMSDQFENADRVAKETGRRRRIMDDDSSVFMKYAFKLRWIRQWYLSKKPQDEERPVEAQPLNLATPNVDMMSQWSEYQFDDNFWQDLMSSDIFDVPLGNLPFANCNLNAGNWRRAQ